MLKIVSWGVKQDKKHAVAVWKTERYFEVKPKDKKQDWEADRHMNFLKKLPSIYTYRRYRRWSY